MHIGWRWKKLKVPDARSVRKTPYGGSTDSWYLNYLMIKLTSRKTKDRGDFGPWDVYIRHGNDWELDKTYYYREDIPDELRSNEKVAVVIMGMDPPDII